ncbi:MAG: hypothetical protein J7M39_15770 [Anaerolineae bacterium]|nr:hypothetical protein [Anaerolineae bacterium]
MGAGDGESSRWAAPLLRRFPLIPREAAAVGRRLRRDPVDKATAAQVVRALWMIRQYNEGISIPGRRTLPEWAHLPDVSMVCRLATREDYATWATQGLGTMSGSRR